MKHPYQPACACARCVKERARRAAQADADPRRHYAAAADRSRQARRDRRFATWAAEDDGPGEYEINGPDRITPDV
jgi:hypothetical protein